MPDRPKVLIIGAGLAGTAAALFLAEEGVELVLYEGHAKREPVGGALGLAPNGLFVLGRLGLADRAIRAGTTIDAFRIATATGKTMGRMPWSAPGRYRYPAVSLSRSTVWELLLDAVEARGLPVEYGKRLVGVDQDRRGITARFADGTSAHGDLLIGADGIGSAARAAIVSEAPRPAFTGLVASGGFLNRRAMTEILGPGREHEMVLSYGAGAFIGYGYGDASEKDGAYWWYALPRDRPLDQADRAALAGAGGMKAVLASGDWSPTIRAILAASEPIMPAFDLNDVASLPAWSGGRAVLIGDAAHAVSPHSGQGVSMALEDAAILARTLREHAFDPGAAFAAFEAERRPRTDRVIALGRRNGDQKRRGPLRRTLQAWLAPLFMRFAPPPHWLYGFEAI